MTESVREAIARIKESRHGGAARNDKRNCKRSQQGKTTRAYQMVAIELRVIRDEMKLELVRRQEECNTSNKQLVRGERYLSDMLGISRELLHVIMDLRRVKTKGENVMGANLWQYQVPTLVQLSLCL